MLPLLFTLLGCLVSQGDTPSATAATTASAGDAKGGGGTPSVTVEVMDVGQGDAIYIHTAGGKKILIDASESAADVVDKLRQRGVSALDLVVATHPHADHIGGMDDVVAGLPIKNYIDNGLPHTTATYNKLMSLIEEKGITYRPAVQGMSFNLDSGAKLEVLFPQGTPLTNTRSDLNSNSVVTRLTVGKDCFLFTGDSEEPTEERLEHNGLGPCGVLKVAHHGSNHSTTPAFLREVQPKIAVISVGTGNRYGHPGEETMARLQQSGAQIYRTDLQGDIVLTSSGSGVKVTTGKGGASPAAVSKAPAGAAAAMDDADGCTLVASSSGKVYHTGDCHNAANIAAEKRQCFASPKDARASGRTPAGCCNPP